MSFFSNAQGQLTPQSVVKFNRAFMVVLIIMNSKYMYLAFWFESLAFKKRKGASPHFHMT